MMSGTHLLSVLLMSDKALALLAVATLWLVSLWPKYANTLNG